MEYLALLPVLWLIAFLMDRSDEKKKHKDIRSDECIDVELPLLKEIDEEIMLVKVVQNKRTNNYCIAFMDVKLHKCWTVAAKTQNEIVNSVMQVYNQLKERE